MSKKQEVCELTRFLLFLLKNLTQYKLLVVEKSVSTFVRLVKRIDFENKSIAPYSFTRFLTKRLSFLVE